jgi:uncharacterized protein
MRIVDANVLIYAVNASVPQHAVARDWLDDSLNGTETVGFDWVVLLAFIRITTRPGILSDPLAPAAALGVVEQWLAAPPAQVVGAGVRHVEVLRNLLTGRGTAGNLTTDAHLAAVAIELGAELWSFDRDFAAFPGLTLRLLPQG